MFIPDYKNKKVFQLSNDAFFYLYSEEAPLDEANLEEAEEIQAMFPNGYEILDGWSYVDEDLIQATFIPYIETKESSFDYDEYWEGSKAYVVQIKWLNATRVKACIFNPISGALREVGELEVLTNNNGKKFIQLPNASNIPGYTNVFYLDKFTCK